VEGTDLRRAAVGEQIDQLFGCGLVVRVVVVVAQAADAEPDAG